MGADNKVRMLGRQPVPADGEIVTCPRCHEYDMFIGSKTCDSCYEFIKRLDWFLSNAEGRRLVAEALVRNSKTR